MTEILSGLEGKQWRRPTDATDNQVHDATRDSLEMYTTTTHEINLGEVREEIAAIFSDTVEDMGSHDSLTLPEKTYARTELESLATEFDFPIEVDGKTMNANIQGTGDVVVLLAGRGVTAPAYDMAPLIAELKGERTVVTLDMFGSGLSDMTDRLRTPEQIAKEIHEALNKLGTQKYSIVAHSISGIRALQYANMFPDEVEAVIGIDTAVPNMDELLRQHNPELLEETPSGPESEKSVHDLVMEDIADVEGYEFSQKDIEIMEALKARNMLNDDIFEANKKLQSGETTEKPHNTMKFPENIPVSFVLSDESSRLAPWYKPEHVKQMTSAFGVCEVLPGNHFLHHTQAPAIARVIIDSTAK